MTQLVRVTFAFALLSGLALGLCAAQERVEDGNLVLEGIPEIPKQLTERLRQYQNTRSAYFAGWHPSGEGILIGTRFGETGQVHWVKSPGGARRQLTFFNEPVSGVAVSPNPDIHSFVFMRDVGGSENYQIFQFDLENSSSLMLTDGRSRNNGTAISNRGDRLAFSTNQRNGRDWDIHLTPVTGGEASTSILEKGGAWVAGDWSPDDSKILVARFVSAADIHPYILDLATKELTDLKPSDEPVAYGGAVWSKDGKGMYFSSDDGTEFMQLRYQDLETGEVEILTPDIPWDVGAIGLSPNGEWLVFTVNEDGIGKLHLWKAATREEVTLPELPIGQVFGVEFSPDSSKLALVLNTPQTPGDVFVLEIAGGKLVRWTYSEVGGLDSSKFVVPTLIHYPTFDEVDGKPREIPAFYYKPAGDGPFPVLVEIHGGPESQARPAFNAGNQALVTDFGIALLVPNVRGSTGYGKS
ncbi:MAG: S9 family peptidase, partial [bacterium]|nr:S9 family peptidase [bacterium]